MEILIGSGFAELINENDLISGRKNRGNSSNILKDINSPAFFEDLKQKEFVCHIGLEKNQLMANI